MRNTETRLYLIKQKKKKTEKTFSVGTCTTRRVTLTQSKRQQFQNNKPNTDFMYICM